MKILVTGGAGFIGSHLSERLLEEGHKVICFDNFSDFGGGSDYVAIKWKNISNCINDPEYKLVSGDIRNRTDVNAPFEEKKIDVVIHLAARTGVRPSVQDPPLCYKVNVLGTINVLQLCVQYNVKQLIFASSSSIYGCNSKIPFLESDKVDSPLSPYAATKKAGENICFVYHKLYDLHTTILRPFTVYGPRQRKKMAISSFTRQISNGEKITIFGDGTNSRDYTFVEDAIEGFVKSIGRKGFEIFNIGGGNPISLSKLICLIEEKVGKKAEIEYDQMQPGEVTHTFASTEKAKILLGYSSKIKIEEGLSRYIEWYRRDKIIKNEGVEIK